MNKLVPFGKYRGKPVEVMAADRDYCDWLAAQPWFMERYRDVYNVVINCGAEAAETPEHNAMQAEFLDHDVCLRLWAAALPDQAKLAFASDDELKLKFGEHLEEGRAPRCKGLANNIEHLEGLTKGYLWSDPQDMPDGWLKEQVTKLRRERERLAEEKDKTIADYEISIDRVHPQADDIVFESAGWDVVFAIKWETRLSGVPLKKTLLSDVISYAGYRTMLVELKPTMGDDYPSVLRQIKSYRTVDVYRPQRVVLTGEYTGIGASLDKVRKIFAMSGVVLLLVSDLRALPMLSAAR